MARQHPPQLHCTHAFLLYRGWMAKHCIFPDCLAARVPYVIRDPPGGGACARLRGEKKQHEVVVAASRNIRSSDEHRVEASGVQTLMS